MHSLIWLPDTSKMYILNCFLLKPCFLDKTSVSHPLTSFVLEKSVQLFVINNSVRKLCATNRTHHIDVSIQWTSREIIFLKWRTRASKKLARNSTAQFVIWVWTWSQDITQIERERTRAKRVSNRIDGGSRVICIQITSERMFWFFGGIFKEISVSFRITHVLLLLFHWSLDSVHYWWWWWCWCCVAVCPFPCVKHAALSRVLD